MVRKIISLFLVLTAFYYEPSYAVGPITAKSWLVSDETGKIIDGENIYDVRSIASITKLVTVMVVLDAKQDLNQRIGKFTRKELIQMTLVKSDNDSAKVLCDNYPGKMVECVHAMNIKMTEHGLEKTKFVEPTGLNMKNVSTAEELVKIVMMAKEYPEIVESSNQSTVKIQTSKNNWFAFNNTNPIIGKKYNFTVSKTGYISASGGCIVMMLHNGIHERIIILLGSKDTKTRIPEADRLVQLY